MLCQSPSGSSINNHLTFTPIDTNLRHYFRWGIKRALFSSSSQQLHHQLDRICCTFLNQFIFKLMKCQFFFLKNKNSHPPQSTPTPPLIQMQRVNHHSTRICFIMRRKTLQRNSNAKVVDVGDIWCDTLTNFSQDNLRNEPETELGRKMCRFSWRACKPRKGIQFLHREVGMNKAFLS